MLITALYKYIKEKREIQEAKAGISMCVCDPVFLRLYGLHCLSVSSSGLSLTFNILHGAADMTNGAHSRSNLHVNRNLLSGVQLLSEFLILSPQKCEFWSFLHTYGLTIKRSCPSIAIAFLSLFFCSHSLFLPQFKHMPQFLSPI